jgi:alanine or glycine:cation symporter, AGCS family
VDRKTENIFQQADVLILSGTWSETNPEHQTFILDALAGKNTDAHYTGNLAVAAGQLPTEITMIHARSIADNVIVAINGDAFSGNLSVEKGQLKNLPLGLNFTGSSLIHSAPLTARAFNKGMFGNFGQYIVSIGLLLFAFSTAISWSYYGDRSVTFLLGSKYVKYYRIIYVAGFFFAAIVDTTLIWTFSGIAIALMTLPNLIGILLLRKDMKATVADYWKRFVPGKGIID